MAKQILPIPLPIEHNEFERLENISYKFEYFMYTAKALLDGLHGASSQWTMPFEYAAGIQRELDALVDTLKSRSYKYEDEDPDTVSADPEDDDKEDGDDEN